MRLQRHVPLLGISVALWVLHLTEILYLMADRLFADEEKLVHFIYRSQGSDLLSCAKQ